MTVYELAIFEEKIRADERQKVLDEVIKTLGNDYWNIAKIEQLKEQKNV